MATRARAHIEATVSIRRPFKVLLTREGAGGYSARVEGLPGCYSQGETLAETKRNIREAIGCHLEALALIAGRGGKVTAPGPKARKAAKASP